MAIAHPQFSVQSSNKKQQVLKGDAGDSALILLSLRDEPLTDLAQDGFLLESVQTYDCTSHALPSRSLIRLEVMMDLNPVPPLVPVDESYHVATLVQRFVGWGYSRNMFKDGMYM